MHRGKYKEFDVDSGYIKNINTCENCGKHLDLYCYTADENNIYYDEPHIDYPENYVHVIDEQEIPISKYMQERGDFNIPHAIISKHKRISSIERFKIDECNNFFSAPIGKDTADFLLKIGLDKFIVINQIWNFYLTRCKTSLNSPYTLLFFLTSDDPQVRYELNMFRRHILLNNRLKDHEKRLSEGIYARVNNEICQFTYSNEDKVNLALALNNQYLPLINHNRLYDEFNQESLIELSSAFENLKKKLDESFNNYVKYLSNLPEDFDMRDWSKYPNFLIKDFYTEADDELF